MKRNIMIAAIGAAGLLSGCDEKPTPLVTMVAPAVTVIEAVDVLDVAAAKVLKGRDVIIRDGRIASIRPAGSAPLPDGAERIDGAGASLLPGLIDMHSHVGFSSAPRWASELPNPPRNLQAYLYSGVTTVFDTGGMDNKIFDLRARVAAGELPGPRIFAVGPLVTAKGGHPAALIDRLAPWWIDWYIIRHQVRQVDSAQQAREAVSGIAELGADAIKLVSDQIPEGVPQLDPAQLSAAADQARTHGLPAVAHIGRVSDALATAEAGVSLWVHGVYKERISDADIRRIASYGIPMVPTMVVFENYALLGRGPRRATPLERQTVKPELLRAFDDPPQSDDTAAFRPYLDLLHSQRENARDNVRRLHAAGVTMMAGSDMQSGVFPGAGLHRELHLLHEAGLAEWEVLRAATINAARFLAASDTPDFGLVREGARADLLLVNGDPSQDLDAIDDIRAVLRAGRRVQRLPLGG